MNKEFLSKNFVFIVSAFALIVLVVAGILFFENNTPASGGEEMVSAQEVEAKVLKYLEESIAGTASSVISIEEKEGLYEVVLEVQGQEYITYVSRNGRFFFPQGIDLDEFLAAAEMVTRERPDVKLFVMSYCPYGLQAQKGLLPAWELLKNEANIGIYFVDYIMHEKEEATENLRQYCIGTEQEDRIIGYLSCFADSGETRACLTSSGVDEDRLNSCVLAADEKFGVSRDYEDRDSWISGYYPRFSVHAALNEQYNVSGSPTLVINDKVVNLSNRSPESFKEAICGSFETPPEACLQVLSSETPLPGFGSGVGNVSGGSCG